MTEREYREAAASAIALLRDPAVAAGWDHPSALAEFGVAGLAGHLARQVLVVPYVLGVDGACPEPISLIEHYTRSEWVGADARDEVSAGIRHGGEEEAADGPAALAERAGATIAAI